jgi:hypothetical protein
MGLPSFSFLGFSLRTGASDFFPDDVAYLSIWSRLDGVVNPRACHDPAARLVEVRSSHCGMAWNPEVFRAVLDELTEVADRERPRDEALAA